MFLTDKLKKTIFLSLCVVFSLALGFLESFIPLSGSFPGIRIGIANIVILSVIYIYSVKEGILCAFLKSVLALFMYSNLSSFTYSVFGSMLSALGMGIFKNVKSLSPVGVSLIGSFLHITAQIVIAYISFSTGAVFYYYPYLRGVGIITGFINGYLVKLLLVKLERSI